MSESEMQAELERLREENARLKSKDKGGLTLKVSEKGRFPSTQWAGFRSHSIKSSGSASLPMQRR
jgi:hypothetical protein